LPQFYSLCGQILRQTEETPYLGITITDNLKWNSQARKTAKKANCTLNFLIRNLKRCPQECRRTAYIGLVRSILEYGATIWDPYLQQDIDILERVQRKAARFISGDFKTREEGCVTRMLRNAGLAPLADRRRMQRLILFYKVVEGKVPALPSHEFLIPIRNKCKGRARDLSEHTHFVSTYSHNNSRGFKVDNCKTANYKDL
jgi:hypothetical protein